MKTLRTFLASALLALSATAMADEYQYLTVTETSGETNYAVSNIQKITFDSTYMVLHLSDGTTQQVPLSGLTKMFFSDGQAGIATTQMQSKIQFHNGILRADVASGESISVFNMKGEKVFSAHASGTYDLSTLTKGVYIIKVGQETRKVINK
ncbi:MAG: T9SS type A sorting domain-containing protein [Prevotella sp.]|nr:T9SS type A sorting domain-containing protein [Prevotella sp.]